MHQMFSVHTKSEESHDYRDVIVLDKLRFLMCPVHTKSKSRCFSVDGRPNRRNKAAFSDFSDVMRTLSNAEWSPVREKSAGNFNLSQGKVN